MARKVTWTEIAWSDLEAAADYIAKDSPSYAAAFAREGETQPGHWPIWQSEGG